MSDNIVINVNPAPLDPININVVSDPIVSVNGKTGIVVLTKNDIGLNLVDNTSDLNKPVSYDTLSALLLKTDLGLFLTLNDYVTSNSINWNSVYLYVNSLSSNNASVYSNVNSLSSNWNNAYNTSTLVQTKSAFWEINSLDGGSSLSIYLGYQILDGGLSNSF